MRSKVLSRRDVALGSAAFGAASAFAPFTGAASAASIGVIEKPKLNLGLAVPATTFLPIYVAAEKIWKDQGLDIQVVSFRGDAEVSQALAGDSIDIAVQSVDGLVNLIVANQPAIGFFAGFNQADFAWSAKPSIKTWADLKGGKLVGVSTFGSLTHQLTVYALQKAGVDPAHDVRFVQAGPAGGRFQALKSGRLDAAILSAPYKWMADEQGLTSLGGQAKDVSPNWPKHEIVAKVGFLDKNPGTAKAFLRSHVAAIRLARAQPEMAIEILARNLKYSTAYAKQAYEDVIGGFDERGRLPDASMSTFWDIMTKSNEVKAPWPNEKILDDRFVASFASWAPSAG
jgi:NitT/TauT family transport system substrate-binding protein